MLATSPARLIQRYRFHSHAKPFNLHYVMIMACKVDCLRSENMLRCDDITLSWWFDNVTKNKLNMNRHHCDPSIRLSIAINASINVSFNVVIIISFLFFIQFGSTLAQLKGFVLVPIIVRLFKWGRLKEWSWILMRIYVLERMRASVKRRPMTIAYQMVSKRSHECVQVINASSSLPASIDVLMWVGTHVNPRRSNTVN